MWMSPIHVWMFVSLVGWVKLDLQGVIYVYLPYSSNAESEKKPGKEATCKFSNILVEAKKWCGSGCHWNCGYSICSSYDTEFADHKKHLVSLTSLKIWPAYEIPQLRWWWFLMGCSWCFCWHQFFLGVILWWNIFDPGASATFGLNIPPWYIG